MVEPGIHLPPPVSTPRLAPWDHVQALCNKLDRLIALLEGAAPAPPAEWPGWDPVISKLDEIKNQLKELTITAVTTWEAAEPVEIYRESIRAAGTSYTEFIDWKRGKRLILKVKNTLDQGVQIQAIGNINNAIDDATEINTAKPCLSNSSISIGPAWDDWHPYIWAKITVAVAPTTGTLTISAVIQE